MEGWMEVWRDGGMEAPRIRKVEAQFKKSKSQKVQSKFEKLKQNSKSRKVKKVFYNIDQSNSEQRDGRMERWSEVWREGRQDGGA